jgi:hypothetical protein
MIAVTAAAVGIGVGVVYCQEVVKITVRMLAATRPTRGDQRLLLSPLQTLTLDEGEELTELVVDRYNDLYGCDRLQSVHARHYYDPWASHKMSAASWSPPTVVNNGYCVNLILFHTVWLSE